MIAVSRRSTGSLLKTHPRLGKLDVHHSSIVGRCPARANVRVGSKAEVAAFPEHVRCSPNNRHSSRRAARLLCAISDHGYHSKLQLYSIPSTTGAIDRTRGAPQGVKFEESLLRFADEVALAIFRLTI